MYYKAVSLSYDGKPWVSWSTPVPDQVVYRLGKWSCAQPHRAKAGYHLLVFDNLQAAQEFVIDFGSGDYQDHAIFECKVKGVIKKMPPMITVIGDSTWPEGTVMAEEVMLLEEIER